MVWLLTNLLAHIPDFHNSYQAVNSLCYLSRKFIVHFLIRKAEILFLHFIELVKFFSFASAFGIMRLACHLGRERMHSPSFANLLINAQERNYFKWKNYIKHPDELFSD